MRKFYSDLSDKPNDDQVQRVATRCLVNIKKLGDPSICQPKKTTSCTVVLKGAASLQNIVNNPDINKDTKLLDDLSSIIGDADASTVFMPHMQKIREALPDARKSI